MVIKKKTLVQKSEEWSERDFQKQGRPHHHCSESKRRAWLAGEQHGYKRGKKDNKEFYQLFNKRTEKWELFECRTGNKLHVRVGPPKNPESEPQYDCPVYKKKRF